MTPPSRLLRWRATRSGRGSVRRCRDGNTRRPAAGVRRWNDARLRGSRSDMVVGTGRRRRRRSQAHRNRTPVTACSVDSRKGRPPSLYGGRSGMGTVAPCDRPYPADWSRRTLSKLTVQVFAALSPICRRPIGGGPGVGGPAVDDPPHHRGRGSTCSKNPPCRRARRCASRNRARRPQLCWSRRVRPHLQDAQR